MSPVALNRRLALRRLPLAPTATGSTQGLLALRDELVDQGVLERELIDGTGIPRDWFANPETPITYALRLNLVRRAWRLSRRPDTALRAGERQQISHFGLFGYAMASSRTLGEALRFGLSNIELAGPLLRIVMEQRDGRVIFRTQNPPTFGPLLPFMAEFWRSSMSTLLSRIIDRPFPNLAMYFSYSVPGHVASYERVFRCPLHFGADRMEWHFDASVLDSPCPSASHLTAVICSSFCDRVLGAGEGSSELEREVRLVLLGRPGDCPSAADVAALLGMSLRTFFRRLAEEGSTFQSLLDDVRRSVAVEFLESTDMSVDEVAHRVGFADASNFRKAFRKWTGANPASFRRSTAGLG